MKKIWSITVALVATVCIVGSVFAAQSVSDIISKSKARETALTVTTGTVEEIELEKENGRLIYEVEMKNGSSGETEVKVDAVTAEVLSVEQDDRGYSQNQPMAGSNNAKQQTKTNIVIGTEKAGEIALQAVDGGTIKEIELDEDDGKLIYEVEIKTSYGEAEVDIEAYSGKVLEIEKDRDGGKKRTNHTEVKAKSNTSSNSTKQTAKTNSVIGIEKAAEIALRAVDGGTIKEIELDEDDGKLIYEVEIKTSYGEAEVDIEAYSGKVLSVEYDD